MVKIRTRLAASIQPGAYLMVSEFRADTRVENAAWCKLLVHGGANIVNFLAAKGEFRVLRLTLRDYFAVGVLQRVGAMARCSSFKSAYAGDPEAMWPQSSSHSKRLA